MSKLIKGKQIGLQTIIISGDTGNVLVTQALFSNELGNILPVVLNNDIVSRCKYMVTIDSFNTEVFAMNFNTEIK
jgi:hypothetical protein